MRHLHFEDFLEALCRLSALLALPTDDDLEEVRVRVRVRVRVVMKAAEEALALAVETVLE